MEKGRSMSQAGNMCLGIVFILIGGLALLALVDALNNSATYYYKDYPTTKKKDSFDGVKGKEIVTALLKDSESITKEDSIAVATPVVDDKLNEN
jgi:hypothetical protein